MNTDLDAGDGGHLQLSHVLVKVLAASITAGHPFLPPPCLRHVQADADALALQRVVQMTPGAARHSVHRCKLLQIVCGCAQQY